MIKIVVLDGITVNPGDMDWSPLSRFGEIIIYNRTKRSEIIGRAKDAEILLTNKCVLDRETLKKLPSLKYIGVMATGYNNIDLKTASEQGITVTNVPAYSTESVVQTVFGLITELYSRIGWHSDNVRNGGWSKSKDFCVYRLDMREMSGKTIGIIGYGKIGGRVADVAEAFGMKPLIYNKGRDVKDGRAFVKNIEEIFSESDIISLNCPETPENRNMINADTLSLIKPGAIIINTARGGLVDEDAVADALLSGILSGYGADVMKEEPPSKSSKLIGAKNTVITSHIAWATIESRKRLVSVIVENVERYLSGNTQNKVN